VLKLRGGAVAGVVEKLKGGFVEDGVVKVLVAASLGASEVDGLLG
jgi:hypothetical protein